MSGMEHTLTTIRDEQGKQWYLFATFEGPTVRRLIVSNLQRFWTCDQNGDVKEDKLKKMAKVRKTEFTEYMLQTKQAFTGTNQDMTYEMNTQTSVFSWKREIGKDNIKIRLGELNMAEVDSTNALTAVFEGVMDREVGHQAAMAELRASRDQARAEKQESLLRLTSGLDERKAIQQDLFSKFVMVVNTKKRKLREMREGLSFASSAIPARDQETTTSVLHEQEPYEEDLPIKQDSEAETTDEERVEPAIVVEANQSQDSDSLFSDDAAEPLHVVHKGRRRAAVTKKTPTKAVLPQVKKSASKARSSRSIRSIRSTRSDPDAEELMEDF